ncbi:MAG: hypothetical protein ACKODB_05825 [Betaproteobacteria bacterium]
MLVRPDGHVAWRSDTHPESTERLVSAVTGNGPARKPGG